MKRLKVWALACGLFLITCGCAVTVGAEEETDVALRILLDQLVKSVQVQDDVGVDAAVCVDVLAPAYVERQARLGLVPDARDPEILDRFRQKYRSAVYDRFNDLLRRGQKIEKIDTSRIQVRDPEDEGNENLLVSENPDDPPLKITATGILGVKLVTRKRLADISVNRVGDRWCLNPVSVD